MKAKVLSTLNHDGQVFEAGSTIDLPAEVVETLVVDGVLSVKEDNKDQVEVEVKVEETSEEAPQTEEKPKKKKK